MQDDFGAEEFHSLDVSGERVLPAVGQTDEFRANAERDGGAGKTSFFQRQPYAAECDEVPFSANAGSRLMRGWPTKRATSIWAGSS